MTLHTFPDGFLWGAASSSCQIEGATLEDGKGESIWDRFSHTPGKILNGDNGDVACDHYHRYKEDIALMKEIGIQSYRYSISWPRIFPEGKGQYNEKGLDFYKRLTYELLKNGIKPSVTLYHWDLPQKLQDIGGWANRDVTDYFVEYAGLLFEKLGDVVPYWITQNEPWIVAFLGHMMGVHAPGIKDLKTALEVFHNILLSHGKAVGAYRQLNLPGKIGIAPNFSTKYPASDKKEDIEAYQRYASLFGKNSYVNLEYKVKDILVSPGEKKRVDEFIKLMSKDKQALDTFKKASPLLFIPKKRLENLTDPKDIDRAYRRFSYLLVTKPELREAYFNQLKKDGYNMVIDDGDRLAKISSSPIIIFDREKSLTPPKIKKPS